MSLKPDKYYYRSKRHLVRSINAVSDENKSHAIAVAMTSLAENGNTYDVWEFLGRFTPHHIHQVALMDIAITLGNCDLVRMLIYIRTAVDHTNLVKATRLEHWDLLEFLSHDGQWQHRSKVIAASSVAGAKFINSRPAFPPIEFNSASIFGLVIDICYEHGFDREILEHYANRPDCIIRDCGPLLPLISGTYHPTAPKTMRYLMNKYPGVDWSAHSAARFADHGLFTDAQLRKEMYNLFLEAGFRP